MIMTLYLAGLFGLMSLALGAIPAFLRAKQGVSVGDGGDERLLVAMRRHANFIEYVPIALVLFGLLEHQGANQFSIAILGTFLFLGRVSHAWGIRADDLWHPARSLGAGITAFVLLVLSVWAIGSAWP